MEGILPLLHGPVDGCERGELRPLRQARFGVRALLGLQTQKQASSAGLQPKTRIGSATRDVRATGGSAERRREIKRGTCSSGLAGGAAVGGAHGRAGGSSVSQSDDVCLKILLAFSHSSASCSASGTKASACAPSLANS